MGAIVPPTLVRPFAAVLYRPDIDVSSVIAQLRRRIGAVLMDHGPFPFTYTDYYCGEMGTPLFKRYFVFDKTIRPDALAALKVFSNKLETEFACNGNRRVNIDPGYLTNDKLVLASTKNFFHRIYIGKGIYAEVTLHFRKGRYHYFSWTYPDFRESAVLEFLTKARARLVAEMRRAAACGDTGSPK